MMAAPRTNNHRESSITSTSSRTERHSDGTQPSTAGNAGAGDEAALGERGGFEPFVQLASWGHGSFTPLAQFTSGGLLLGEGSGGWSDSDWGGWGLPSAVGSAAEAGEACQVGSGQEGRCRNRDRAHSIRTREGSMEIAPARGELR